MGRIKSRVVAIALVVGCAGPAAFAAPAKQAGPAAPAAQAKPPAAPVAQAKPKDARLVRLYFLREKGILGAMGGLAASAEIKIDGKPVGKLEMGSYFVVDRPPGVHTIASHTTMAMADYDVEVQLEAGKTYYFGVGTQRGALLFRTCSTRRSRAAAGSRSDRHRPSSPPLRAWGCSGWTRPPAPPRSRS